MEYDEKDLSPTTKRTFQEDKEVNPKKEESKQSTWNKKKIKMLLYILIPILVIVLVIVLCETLIKKKKEDEKKEANNYNYITVTYNAQKGVPLKLFNPSRLGLTENDYTLEQINTGTTRRLQELNITDGVFIPETTDTIQIKITFNKPLTSLDFMFEGCSNLIKVSLSKIDSSLISSMIYTFTDCSNLETVDLTSFSSSKVEKMEFLFAGCNNLVNLKGFEKLDTSSLQKAAGMFIECKNLMSVNLSAFQLNNISEQNGMFIDNPSLETLDLGNTSDISGLFSSTENFKVTIITTSSEINSSGLSGEFNAIRREENQRLNCTKRNWTEFLYKHAFLNNISVPYLQNIIDIYIYNESILKQYSYEEIKEYTPYICNLLNISDNDYNNDYELYNNSECINALKRFYKDYINEFEKCSECGDEEDNRMYCKSCYKGYYVPKGIDFTPTKCKKCDEGCLECVSDNETDNSV